MAHRSTVVDTTLLLMFHVGESDKHVEIVSLMYTRVVPWASLDPRPLFAVSRT